MDGKDDHDGLCDISLASGVPVIQFLQQASPSPPPPATAQILCASMSPNWE